MIGNDLFTLLGPIVGGRFYADVAPQDADTPFIVYETVHRSGGLNLGGDDSTREERGRFHVVGKTSNEATGIITEIEEILHGKTQTIGTKDSVTARLEGEFSVYDEDPRVYRRVVDYKFSYFAC